MDLIRSILLSKCDGVDIPGMDGGDAPEQAIETLRAAGLMEGNMVTEQGRYFADLIRSRVMWAKIRELFAAHSFPMTIESVRGVAERIMEYSRR